MVAATTLLAFVAAVMPQRWIVATAIALGMEPFPDSPLTFYLARNLSALYGLVGAGLWILTMDLDRYRPLIRPLAIGTIVFAILQWIVDTQSGLPAWWTYGESLSTLVGGLIIGCLNRWAAAQHTPS